MNRGILASMSWNSNKWAAPSTVTDLQNSNYGYVQQNEWMNEDINFGHQVYSLEEDEKYIAYTPMFNRLPSLEQSNEVEVVFFRSLNHQTRENFIVGLYAFPEIGHFDRSGEEDIYDNYNWGNVRSKASNIELFEMPLPVSNDLARIKGYLPIGRKLGAQGFNYLQIEQCIKILDAVNRMNPGNTVAKRLKFHFLKKP
jgi:hypothetical protein